MASLGLLALMTSAPPVQAIPIHIGSKDRSEMDGVGTRLTHVLATDWGMTLKSDGSGFYNDLARRTIMEADMGSDYEIQPYRRAKARFFDEKTSCLYPSNLKLLMDGKEIEKTDGLIESAPIIRVRVYVFSRPGTTPPASADAIEHKVLAYAMGSRVPYFLRDANIDFIAVTDEAAKAQMLLTGRVDLISAAMPDLKFVMDRLGAPLPPFNPAFELNNTQVRVVCHDTPDNRVFIGKLNAHMKKIEADGTLAGFLNSQGLDATHYLPGGDR
ncbi:transporter substrate-binding domain-containing protein [Kordiimonas marina]|uniref:transporter substrate-binding domain-containing protein n=1 Tax=Kordiimonas marina TaxID=2872312 RepID=UPI001FF5CDB2|nr:transporter substrate-binding domain-containing protein [Kordiimonas marina]MCJ9428651.1 transporter substrate-binding domain-containing protein [Kordiimonas marina]